MTQKTHPIRSRPRLVLKQETVRVLTTEQLTLVAGGSLTQSSGCSVLSGCPTCKPP
jgi:hypothetical protein